MLLHLFRSLSCWSLALQLRYGKCTDFFHASVFHARQVRYPCVDGGTPAQRHCVDRSMINELRRKLQRTRQSFVVYIQNANSPADYITRCYNDELACIRERLGLLYTIANADELMCQCLERSLLACWCDYSVV